MRGLLPNPSQRPFNNMFLRELNEAREHRELAGFALKSTDSLGRAHPEKEDKFRPLFLRDRDRVIHSAAFRRLEYKTQVFVNIEGDYYRTRLTHTLEVSQIARSVAYSLRLNEGFVEALALAHDLGHPPFGHAGEEILNRLMNPYGGFEHNRQGLRIVDLLEKKYPEFDGLNLTRELRASILKHGTDDVPQDLERFFDHPQPLLEAQVVDIADRVAYSHHDLDDGLKAGILAEEGLMETSIWKRASKEVGGRYPKLPDRIRVLQIANRIIKWIINDLITYSFEILMKAALKNAGQARNHSNRLIGLSSEMEEECRELNQYLSQHFYRHYKVVRTVVRSERILSELFHGYKRWPETLPPEFRSWADQVGLERAVCDYIAGMTDRFASEEWRRLLF